MPELNPRHQAIRALVANMDSQQFTLLKASLEQSRAVIDARLAALDAERTELSKRKQQLDIVLERFAKPGGLESVKTSILKGERLSTRVVVPAKPASPAKPAKPAKPATVARPAKKRAPKKAAPTRRPRG